MTTDQAPEPFGGFYRGRRVLVTGHTGFKGSWLTMWLEQLGAAVTGLSLAPETDPNMFSLVQPEGLRSIIGDIRDPDTVLRAVQSCEPEVILHLAADPIVRRSYDTPAATFATNVQGTAHVLDAAIATPSVKAVVAVTSDKCYRNDEHMWSYREIDPLGGKDPYSASKAAAELVIGAYGTDAFAAHVASKGLNPVPIASARAGNVIGGGDWSESRLVADLARALAADESLTIRNPDALRPWQHVLEPLSGYLQLGATLATKPATARGAWNFGPALDTDAVPVADLITSLLDRLGESHDRLVVDQDTSGKEATLLTLDSTKARMQLGWMPAWRIDRCVAMTADWYAAQLRGATADELMALTRSQISAYVADARTAGSTWATSSRTIDLVGLETAPRA